MINFKKMDDKDFVFINKNLSEKEDKEFSDFLKKRKAKIARKNEKESAKELNNNIHSLKKC